MRNLWNVKNSKLVALLIALALVVTLMPATNAEAVSATGIANTASKATRTVTMTSKTNNKIATLYIGEYYSMTVKKAVAKVKWTVDKDDVVIIRSTGKTTAEIEAVGIGSVTITATTKKGKKYTYKFEVTKPELIETTIYMGWPAKLEFDGPEVESFTVEENKYFTLENDGSVVPTNVTQEPVNVVITCKNGQIFTYGINVSEKEFSIHEPEEDQWGLLYVHDKEYEYIPEMTFHNIETEEQLTTCLTEMIQHGTTTAHFIDSTNPYRLSNEFKIGTERSGNPDYISGAASLIRSYSLEPMESMHYYWPLPHRYDELPEHGSWNFTLNYCTGTNIVYSMMLKGYPSLDQIQPCNYCVALNVEGAQSHYDIVLEGCKNIVNQALQEEATIEGVIRNICTQIKELGVPNRYNLVECGEYDLLTEKTDEGKYNTGSHFCQTACGLFVSNVAVCAGYCDALNVCFTMLGLDNARVLSKDCGHMFPGIRLNGEWHYIYTVDADKYELRKYHYNPFSPEAILDCNDIVPMVNGPYIYIGH